MGQYIILKTGQDFHQYEYLKKSKEDFHFMTILLNQTSKEIEMFYFVLFIVLDPHTQFPWTISKLLHIWSKSQMINPFASYAHPPIVRDHANVHEIGSHIPVVADRYVGLILRPLVGKKMLFCILRLPFRVLLLSSSHIFVAFNYTW